jgi:N-acetylglucosamine-6-phosphate deacetylase
VISTTCIRSERIVTQEGVISGEILIRDDVIAAVSASRSGVRDDVIDVGGDWIAPGFIDLHVHGGGGAQCNTSRSEEIRTMARFHARHGTTALLATTVAAPIHELELALDAIAACTRGGPSDGATVLGAHLEGPFISPERPGAMDPVHFLEPSVELAERLLEAGAGTVRMMTLAPELPGALDLVRVLVRAGVVVAIGHSNATYEQTQAAIALGATSATHTFNAMSPLHHREPGVLGAVLDRPEVSCELILDGVHVSPPAARLAYRAKGITGIHLVTDAMQAAGMPDGAYRLGGAAVDVTDGRAVIAAGGSIAGSTLTMDAAVRNAVEFLGLSEPEAIALASVNPAETLAPAGTRGRLAPGMAADLLVVGDLRVKAAMVNGQWVR